MPMTKVELLTYLGALARELHRLGRVDEATRATNLVDAISVLRDQGLCCPPQPRFIIADRPTRPKNFVPWSIENVGDGRRQVAVSAAVGAVSCSRRGVVGVLPHGFQGSRGDQPSSWALASRRHARARERDEGKNHPDILLW